MHPQLQRILDELSAAQVRYRRLLSATPDGRWATRPEPAQWAVGECIAHLNLTARAMQPLLEQAMSDARVLGGPAPRRYRRTFLGALLSAMMGPVPGWGRVRFGRVRTPPPFVPAWDEPRATIVAEFERSLAAHEATLRASDGLPLDRVFLNSPFRAGARYDAYSGWLILVRHIHRHLAQAERLWNTA